VKRFAAVFCAVLIFSSAGLAGRTQAQGTFQEYLDGEYAYSFRYPADWKLQKLPEGSANQDVRVRLHGPKGSSFMVIIDRLGKRRSRAEFEADPNRSKRVEELMQQTTAQVYKSISANIKAQQMTIGERQDLTNEVGIKFYISTLHKQKSGNPIIVAGIHSYPFSKDYSINFMMTAIWDETATKENEILTAVFNSFQLLNESRNKGK
jgi:hypothetical protein